MVQFLFPGFASENKVGVSDEQLRELIQAFPFFSVDMCDQYRNEMGIKGPGY